MRRWRNGSPGTGEPFTGVDAVLQGRAVGVVVVPVVVVVVVAVVIAVIAVVAALAVPGEPFTIVAAVELRDAPHLGRHPLHAVVDVGARRDVAERFGGLVVGGDERREVGTGAAGVLVEAVHLPVEARRGHVELAQIGEGPRLLAVRAAVVAVRLVADRGGGLVDVMGEGRDLGGVPAGGGIPVGPVLRADGGCQPQREDNGGDPRGSFHRESSFPWFTGLIEQGRCHPVRPALPQRRKRSPGRERRTEFVSGEDDSTLQLPPPQRRP